MSMFFYWYGDHYRNHSGTLYRGKRGTIDEQKGSKTYSHLLDTFMFFFAENNSYICRMIYSGKKAS